MEEKKTKPKANKKKRLMTFAVILAVWALLGVVISLISGPGEAEFHMSVEADRVQLGPLNISSSVITAFAITCVLAVALVLINRLVIAKFTVEHPSRFQQVLEIICDYATSYAHSQTEAGPKFLPPYIISVGAILVMSAIVESMGFRSPAADLNFTLALALMTFLLINIFTIAKKGVVGRIKSWAKPVPVVFPIRILSDIATPISLACRLFGNILGGMIVVELIYHALGSFGIGIPAVLGLYFNAFHPLIQAYIFITLSLSFIQEAYE